MTGLSIALEPEPFPRNPLTQVHAVLEFLSDGASLARRLGDGTARTVLSDLACATRELASGERLRTVVRLSSPGTAWELGLERSGEELALTIFQGGALPDIAVHERRIRGDAFAARIIEGIDALVDRSSSDLGLARAARDDGLTRARTQLKSALPFTPSPSIPSTLVSVEPSVKLTLRVTAEIKLYPTPPSDGSEAAVLRTDLFGLLFRGRLKIALGEHVRELPQVFVFLVAEQLATLVEGALLAWSHGRAFHRRTPIGGAICAVRLSPRGHASLTLGIQRSGADDRAEVFTFPAVEIGALAKSVIAFGRALVRGILRCDRAQASNLRLVAFRDQVRELAGQLREVTRNDSKINATPDSYRTFAAVAQPSQAGQDHIGNARLRYSPKWLATVPSIDLRATFLCGDALVVGGARETGCFDRRTGDLVWRRAMTRAVSVVTPAGLARLHADGSLNVHELGTGEVAWSTRLAPRIGSSASGAVINAPGLPRLLLVSEGARHLAAVDLDAGEVRWRHATRRGSVFRMRRAGKLAILASGESSLVALDVLTGDIVWRYCDKLRFASHVAIGTDELYAIAGGAAFVDQGGSRLHHLDPWTGELRRTFNLPTSLMPVGAPLLAEETIVLVTQGRNGTGLYGIDRGSGAVRFERVVCAGTAACMLVDDLIVANGESGELVGVDAKDGSTRYRHMFARDTDDKPRRLEPVLRSGALFVPQHEVHVVRPRDGTLLGRIQTDLIPDLLRVDERCDVYVAEESGHVAAFAAGPRLSLVR
jgi:outer membrane protein assembly factor BamB